MTRNHCPWKKILCIALALLFVFLSGIGLGVLSRQGFTEDSRFEAFTDKLFRQEITGDALTFHYCIAHPEKAGLKRPRPVLGRVTTDQTKFLDLCRKYEKKLKSFSFSRLSRENQLTLEMLLLYFHTQHTPPHDPLLGEMLGPSLGVQAQLPVLLAEYPFYENQDISDYLNLLASTGDYFDSILDFQKEKSKAGLFMSDETLKRVCLQCDAFIKDPENNFMLKSFKEKLSQYDGFSQKELHRLLSAHKKIFLEQVIPAYQRLIDGLRSLKGTGKPSCGLSAFPGGRDYYMYLLKNQAGTYEPAEKIRLRLSRQLIHDIKTVQLMLKEQPSLGEKLEKDDFFPDIQPEKMLELLKEQIHEEFPPLSQTSWELRYVPKSLEAYSSPAFYLTPPLDTNSPNVIYLNRSGRKNNLELFTTLSHEGFPGHLYQTVYFSSRNKNPIRRLIQSGGYIEGWATYVETFAEKYAGPLLMDEAGPDLAVLSGLNRSINLNICSLLDLGIHYYGWSRSQTAAFLRAMGIPSQGADRIFQYIVETPANYLKYYWGYLNFLDLRTVEEKRLEKDFNMKEFHKKVLEIGPAPFPILEKYLTME